MVNTSPQTAEKCKRTRAWERRKEHRPGELLDAALEVFVARGYAAARLDDVAARAGVSKGTLYLYYAGKEDLFKAVVRVNIVPVIEQFRQRIEQATGSNEELLTNVLTDWWHCFSQPHIGGIIKLIIAEASNFPEIARFFHEEVASIGHGVIRQLIQRGVERQEFRKPCEMDVAAHLVMSPPGHEADLGALHDPVRRSAARAVRCRVHPSSRGADPVAAAHARHRPARAIRIGR